ncbi:Hypp2091 [Branchiostoma lanceolatum]|uniref:Hypp2091 protein n=1 Tax=Branchiostoma lanceolatum TaxID=7740 RepID=A0A8J9ZNN0_BRALA|nr:Hypp2091 [Branchiostoma lanceolatum]
MKCLGCKTEKLSKEFPSVTILDTCRHPPLHCFRCLIKVVEQQKKCPHPTCPEKVPGDCARLKEFQATVNRLFAEYTSTSTVDYTTAAAGASGGLQKISVVMMNGESISLSYNPSTTIYQIKLGIQQRLLHHVEKQRLIYNEVELKTYTDSGQLAKMGDYGVQPHSTVHLIIMLYAIPEHFNHAIVMCSVSRKTGVWKIDSLGTLSQGNAKNYEPLKATIRKLIQQGV